MEMREALEKCGGVAGLHRIVIKRYPSPGNSSGELPPQRQDFMKYLGNLEHVARMKGISVDELLNRPSFAPEARTLLELSGVLQVAGSYQSKTGLQR